MFRLCLVALTLWCILSVVAAQECLPQPPTSDSVPVALELPFGPQTFNVCDANFFSITLTDEWSMVSISVEGDEDIFSFVVVSLPGTFSQTFFMVPSVRNFTLPAGSHNITVSGVGNFTLTVTFEGAVTPCPCDANEPINFNHPFLIEELPTTVTGTMCPVYETDAYRFVVNGTFSLGVTMDGVGVQCFFGALTLLPGSAVQWDVIDGNIPDIICRAASLFVDTPLVDLAGAFTDWNYELSFTESPATCFPDEFEPNSFLQPYPIPSFPFSGTNLTLCSGDDDTFSFSIDSAQSLTVTWEGDFINAFINQPGTSSGLENGVAVNLRPGDYSITFAPFFGNGSITYSFTAELDPISECDVDTYEPNDVIAQASAIPFPLPETTFYLCPQLDVDWYSFEVTDDVFVDFNISLPENSFALLRRTDDAQITRFFGSSTSTEMAFYPGGYLLQVVSTLVFSPTLQSYVVSMTVSGPVLCQGGLGGADVGADEETAEPIPFNVTQTVIICPADDIDVYTFTLDDPSTVSVGPVQIGDLFLNLQFWGAGRDRRFLSSDGASMLLDAGQYFLSVAADGFTVGRAALTVSLEGPATFSRDIFEPNDFPENATQVTLPFFAGNLSLSPSFEDDWFTFTLTDNATIFVQALIGQLGTPLWFVLNADLEVIAFPFGKFATSVQIDLEPGQYYIHLLGVEQITPLYTLRIEQRFPEPPFVDMTEIAFCNLENVTITTTDWSASSGPSTMSTGPVSTTDTSTTGFRQVSTGINGNTSYAVGLKASLAMCFSLLVAALLLP